MMRMLLALVAALAMTVPALADDTDIVQFRKEEAVTLKPDKAYVMMRALEIPSSVYLLREPSDAELQAYEDAKRAEYSRKERDEPYEAFAFDWEGAINLYELRMTKEYAKP